MPNKERIELAGGEILFRQGDPVDSFYLLREGSIEVYAKAEDGRAIRVRVLSNPGEIIAECAGDLQTRAVNALAGNHTSLLRVDVDHGGLDAKIRARLEFGLTLAEELASAVWQLGEQLGRDRNRFYQWTQSINQAVRAFAGAYPRIERRILDHDPNSPLPAAVKSSELMEYLAEIPDEGPTELPRRFRPELGTQELEAVGFKTEGEHLRTLPPGMTICQEGEVADNFFFLFRGKMEARVEGYRIGTISDGEFFGEVTALLDLRTRTASLVTLQECKILFIERDGLKPLLKKQPALLVQLCRSLFRRIECLEGDLATLIRHAQRLGEWTAEASSSFPATIQAVLDEIDRVTIEDHKGELAPLMETLKEAQKTIQQTSGLDLQTS